MTGVALRQESGGHREKHREGQCGTPRYRGLQVKMSYKQGQMSGSLAEEPGLFSACDGGPGKGFQQGNFCVVRGLDETRVERGRRLSQ